MSKLIQFIKESREEVQKVNWPSRQQTMNYTLVVIGVSLAVAIFLGGLDLGFAQLMERFIFMPN